MRNWRIVFKPLWPFSVEEPTATEELLRSSPAFTLADHNNRLQERIEQLSMRNVDLAKTNVELSREVVRLSRRHVPAVEEGEIEDPPTTAEADRIAARRGEQSQKPAPGPAQ